MSVTKPSRALLVPQYATDKADIHFARSAPRHLVGRSAVAEVLITDWRRLGPDTFRLGAQWPRGHTFYPPIAGAWHDPLLAAETLWQASVLVGQTYYGVPADQHPVMAELDLDIVPSAILLGPRPAEIRLEISGSDVQSPHGMLTGMTLEVELLRGDEFVGTGRVALRLPAEAPRTDEARTAEHAGRQARPNGLPPRPEPVPAAIVGRLDERDVVLGIPRPAPARRGHTWTLRTDPSHPVLFDHPTDHVPAMLLLEAARQAAQAVCAPYRMLPVELRSAFHGYVELDIPCHIAATKLPPQDAGEDAVVRVTGSQDGKLLFDSLVVGRHCD
ncbi:ScbA/BarX family gamma-butyrolactone biosynthesis protein [Streptomyces sp. H27-D2]|uniref:ScbA/BarX family gamma-butyrolactone biosynthesis protein n=1 Tax=Streptomyces sp. H27-D2 TaxID=3046304 RepID=UPI002DB5EA1F|nr:ScbA/BarX family gamma-butyrolactone biosynthesis protein [Streptomyces sp. H27-D2]MEC4020644.1 ScbA/BarX family gamma-butyrolactone biosynthesis protein [Streptomyces sp. H27-D2]